jgi:CheY-like chemotaxis protein
MASTTILLVEDNDDNRAIYRTLLEYSGYTVLEATDGEAGLRDARQARPDLILLDISIPLMDGWEVARTLKGDPETADIPIIALTAHAMEGDRQKAMEAGCDGYLAKPVEPRLVVEEVGKHLGSRPRS